MAHVPIVRSEDNRKGIITAVIFLLVTLFLLFFIKYHEPDPPKVTTPIPITMAESGIEEFEVSNAGGGTPSETVNPTPETQENPEEQPTQEESPITTETGTGDNESSTTTETESESSPFSGNGSGGSGTGGTGSGFGNDDGPGSGSGEAGTGGSGDRVRLNDLKTKPKTPNDQYAIIQLIVTIDSRGKVVRARVDPNNTTTNNQDLIDEVIELVKKEILYKEKPGARNETAFLPVRVKPG